MAGSTRSSAWRALAIVAVVAGATPASAQLSTPLDDTMMEQFRWRSVGPANMMGRVSDVEGIGSPSKTFFVAAAGGSIWKTTNNGVTFQPVFDEQRVISMGDLAIAPSDTMQIWAGTGEPDSRNSISPGSGIYKSVDGGLTWELKGLEETQAIGRVVVHPTNPDIVYVAALGAIWGSNPERGLYRTTDGGDSWELVKFISDKAGFVDVAMDPRDPEVLFAASWERVRGPYFLNSGGPGSALWKTTDGGDSWTEVVGNGFPTTLKGRIGLAIAPSSPDVMYAMVEAEEEADGSGGNGLYRSADAGASWEKVNDENTRPFYYSQVRVDVANPDRVYFSSTPVKYSDDGGRTAGNTTVGVHVDHHAMWMDPGDPDHMVVGNDGGIAITWDKGGNWQVPNVFAIGQFYHVTYNMDTPYRVCGGLQDNGTWCGPSRRDGGSITNYMWATISGGDGFVTAQHPTNPDIVWAESQGGNMARLNLATGERTGLQKPEWRDRWIEFEDSILVVWDDSLNAPPAAAQERIDRFRAMQRADSASREMRWNWNTPFFVSPHDPSVFYAAGNRVLKSTALGDDLQVISGDLSYADAEKIEVSTRTTGGITPDVTGAETFATIVSLDESPLVRGKLFAGTDDGRLWMSPDDGESWTELTERVGSLVPEGTYVSRIEPSKHDPARFYVTYDNHRRNDFTPYVLVTDDDGASFRSIAAGIPQEWPADGPNFAHVIREDPVNPNLLFVGTDLGVWVSTDRGGAWQRFHEGLPTVPVHDLRIHPRDRELIAGTHGRSIWIVDIAPLQQMTDGVMAEGAVLFEPAPALQFGDPAVGGESTGQGFFQGESVSTGARLTYWLPEAVEGRRVEFTIADASGAEVGTAAGGGSQGFNTAVWNLQGPPPPPEPLSPAARRDSLQMIATVRAVADSLVQFEGGDREALDGVIDNMIAGDLGRGFGGGGFGGGGGAPLFRERPGETPVAGGGGGRGPGGGGPGGGGAQNAMREVFGALRDRGIGFAAFRGRGGGGGAPVDPGIYTATATVDGRTLTTRIEVVRDADYVIGTNQQDEAWFGADSWSEFLERFDEARVEAAAERGR
ncbi:VPS10 domain-containing protein [Gaopeijia maritima]|uniref:Sortilin N-terminal domain-containing protein n=1 Tax=Gaopeijia maritima TaxID=3119007 RepID=A0ABU9EB84_9BACT